MSKLGSYHPDMASTGVNKYEDDQEVTTRGAVIFPRIVQPVVIRDTMGI